MSQKYTRVPLTNLLFHLFLLLIIYILKLKIVSFIYTTIILTKTRQFGTIAPFLLKRLLQTARLSTGNSTRIALIKTNDSHKITLKRLLKTPLKRLHLYYILSHSAPPHYFVVIKSPIKRFRNKDKASSQIH